MNAQPGRTSAKGSAITAAPLSAPAEGQAMTGTHTHRATATGKLWGEVDCYILDDGQRVISQRAILDSIRNPGKARGSETGNSTAIWQDCPNVSKT